MKTEQIICSLFAGVQGYLDKVAESEILPFEKKWLAYLDSNHKDIFKTIADEGALSDATMEGLHGAMASFLGENEFTPRSA